MRRGLLLLGALILAGCGFQLRTWDLQDAFSSAYVRTDEYGSFARDLRRALTQAGVELVEEAEDAEVVVRVLSLERTQRSISVTGQARAAEYEVGLTLRYAATRKNDAGMPVEMLAPQTIRGERVYRVDRDNLIGSSAERTLLEDEIKNDLIGQILRVLNTVASQVTNGADQTPMKADER